MRGMSCAETVQPTMNIAAIRYFIGLPQYTSKPTADYKIVNATGKLKIPHAIRQNLRAAAVRAALGPMVGGKRHLSRPMGAGSASVLTRHSATERHGIAPYGPYAGAHGDRRHGPLASHARRYHAVAAGDGPCGDRDANGGRASACR